MKLVIVESPSKAKTIEKYLGKDYKVIASVGHVRDLPKSNKKALDIEAGFLPHYEVVKGKEKILAEIKRLASKAEEVLLATDPDREGEAIAWHISEAANLKNPERIVFHEITKEAVKKALTHKRKIDLQLKEAQEARRVLDRLVGYDLSGLIWKKVRYGLSAGRVQSPALRILMEREREIRAFDPETFFVISAQVATAKEETFEVICEEEPRSKDKAEQISKKAKQGDWLVRDVIESEVKRSPRAPFTTSTLQQAASTRLGFSPKRTMMVAQKLYEAGYITYMRTDSLHMANEALAQIQRVVEKKFESKNYQRRAYKTKSKLAQEAHEAIRPTDFVRESAGRSEDQKKLYRLIWARAVASQMVDAVMMRTKIIANIAKAGMPDFSALGSRILSEGWLAADSRAKSEDVLLPKVGAGEKLDLKDLATEEKQTQPPRRYSEAGLIKELERRGIGRPSTYASIINTLLDRHYVEKDNRSLVPTDTGDVVSTFLEDNFEEYISDTFTAEMEDELDEIAEGKREYEPTLREFYGPFSQDVKEKEKTAKITTLGDADPALKCPECAASMVVKLGRGGKFLSCERFPDCKGMRNFDGTKIKEAESLGKDPESESEVYILDGRFGPYVQLGENGSGKDKPKRSSIPKEQNPDEVNLEKALKYLSLPRELGPHPETGEMISANIGRFGPYVVHQKDFRSLKSANGAGDDVYSVTLERALEILKEPKKRGRRGKKKT